MRTSCIDVSMCVRHERGRLADRQITSVFSKKYVRIEETKRMKRNFFHFFVFVSMRCDRWVIEATAPLRLSTWPLRLRYVVFINAVWHWFPFVFAADELNDAENFSEKRKTNDEEIDSSSTVSFLHLENRQADGRLQFLHGRRRQKCRWRSWRYDSLCGMRQFGSSVVSSLLEEIGGENQNNSLAMPRL